MADGQQQGGQGDENVVQVPPHQNEAPVIPQGGFGQPNGGAFPQAIANGLANGLANGFGQPNGIAIHQGGGLVNGFGHANGGALHQVRGLANGFGQANMGGNPQNVFINQFLLKLPQPRMEDIFPLIHPMSNNGESM